MLSTRWHKVLRELRVNKTRTLLVVISIAVGIFAVGTVQHLRSVILTEMQAAYQASATAHAFIQVSGQVAGQGGADDELLEAIRRTPGVADAQGRSSLSVKVQVAPGRWENLSLVAIDDFTEVRINRFEPVYTIDGQPQFGAERTVWPEENQIILERSGIGAPGALPAGLRAGDSLLLETPTGKLREVTVSGALYDPTNRAGLLPV